jgi:hypothetical protein
MVIGAIIGVAGTVIGAITTVLLGDFIERRKKPELHMARLDFHRFESSVRLYLVVENRGRQVAKNTIAYLTISLYRDSKQDVNLPRVLLPPKEAFARENRLTPRSWDYLVPASEGFSIVKEPLPWTMPREFGKGRDGDSYHYLADIPARGFNRVLLMDIYRVEN